MKLLFVIAIIAVLAVVVILVLNPVELFRQARDSTRLSDLATMNQALSIFSKDAGSSLGDASTTYISVPDPSATSSAGGQCQGLSLPALPSGWTYHCASPSNYKNVDGTGWIPVNFNNLSSGRPISSLPVDPTNTISNGHYYTYTPGSSQWELTSIPESQKQRATFLANPPLVSFPGVIAQGSNLSLSALWNSSGLMGYWTFDEGSGSTAKDSSGNGNDGGWKGTQTKSSGYYTAGKIGNYAAYFNGSNNFVSISSHPVPHGGSAWPNFTLSSWVNRTSSGYFVVFADLLTSSDDNQTTGNFVLRIEKNSNLLLGFVFTGNNTTPVAFNSSSSVPLNRWTHVAMVSQNHAAKITLYINGVGSGVTSSQSYAAAGRNLTYIGSDDTTSFFSGSIDDVRLYNRALSAAEIEAIYSAQK
jgi:Concanavalin A-like lectin/glucanases superfamily